MFSPTSLSFLINIPHNYLDQCHGPPLEWRSCHCLLYHHWSFLCKIHLFNLLVLPFHPTIPPFPASTISPSNSHTHTHTFPTELDSYIINSNDLAFALVQVDITSALVNIGYLDLAAILFSFKSHQLLLKVGLGPVQAVLVNPTMVGLSMSFLRSTKWQIKLGIHTSAYNVFKRDASMLPWNKVFSGVGLTNCSRSSSWWTFSREFDARSLKERAADFLFFSVAGLSIERKENRRDVT